MDGRSQSDSTVGSMVGHGQHLGRERVQVDLVAKPGAEGLDGLGRVVSTAIESSIHGLLDAARAGWNMAATARVALATTQLGGRAL
jgi:hypothetical protein